MYQDQISREILTRAAKVFQNLKENVDAGDIYLSPTRAPKQLEGSWPAPPGIVAPARIIHMKSLFTDTPLKILEEL